MYKKESHTNNILELRPIHKANSKSNVTFISNAYYIFRSLVQILKTGGPSCFNLLQRENLLAIFGGAPWMVKEATPCCSRDGKQGSL